MMEKLKQANDFQERATKLVEERKWEDAIVMQEESLLYRGWHVTQPDFMPLEFRSAYFQGLLRFFLMCKMVGRLEVCTSVCHSRYLPQDSLIVGQDLLKICDFLESQKKQQEQSGEIEEKDAESAHIELISMKVSKRSASRGRLWEE
jgi:hypothetical protein